MRWEIASERASNAVWFQAVNALNTTQTKWTEYLNFKCKSLDFSRIE